MSIPHSIIAASGIALALAAPAAAQDTGADPTYGTVNLDVGFLPDPHRIKVSSGGEIDASALGSPCTGMIADAPDVRLAYSSGSSPLIISVNSEADTSLVVNAPDGKWYCDDDSGEGLNPSLRFSKPLSGRYEIWIGTYSGSEFHSATLDISEVASQ